MQFFSITILFVIYTILSSDYKSDGAAVYSQHYTVNCTHILAHHTQTGNEQIILY